MNPQDDEPAPALTRHEAEQPASDDSTYTYKTAGITERAGYVPRWLWLVAAGLVVWGIYYLITYWQAPVTPPLP
jgi:hypothetical protein